MFDKRRPDNDISEQRKAQNFGSGGLQQPKYIIIDAWIATMHG